MRALLLVVAMAAIAEAKTPKPAVSDKAKATYTAEMAAGHKAQAGKQWREAQGAFGRALAALPGDATALTELGWTAYLAGDYPVALEVTRKAVKADGAPNVRGAALYNLGLIAEKQGDKPAAIAAYTESLKVRPHSVVRAALAKLDAKAAAATDPFAAIALVKVASVEAFCAAQPAAEDGQKCSCGEETIAGIDAFDVHRECHDIQGGSAGQEQHWLIWQTAGAWWVTKDTIADSWVSLRCSFEATLAGEARGKRQVVTLDTQGLCGDGFNDDSWTEKALIVIGTRDKAPVATPPIVVARKETRTREAKEDPPAIDLLLKPTWDGAGALTLSGRTKGLDATEAHNIIGAHALSMDR